MEELTELEKKLLSYMLNGFEEMVVNAYSELIVDDNLITSNDFYHLREKLGVD